MVTILIRQGDEVEEYNNVVNMDRVYPDVEGGGENILLIEYRPFGEEVVEEEIEAPVVDGMSLTREEKQALEIGPGL